MSIKKIITGGCSFSDNNGNFTWPHILPNYCKNIDFLNTGFPTQGQEMIQKKVSFALINALEIYKPEEICVLVMWSGTDRKSFYVDNKYFIEDLANSWVKNNKFGIAAQFLNLNNQIPSEELGKLSNGGKWSIDYNKSGGWYTFTPAHAYDDSILVDQYQKSHGSNLASTIVSLENIIMLQNLCKLKNIKFYQSFYMTDTYTDIYTYKDNLNINYLYKQLDNDSIVSTQGIFDYLRTFENYLQYFESDTVHPSRLGHEKWVKEILLPKLTEAGVLNGTT